MIRLEALIALKFLNSSFSSLSSYGNRTHTSLLSNSRQRYLSQQYPPTLLTQASLSGTDQTLFEKNNHHAPKLSLYGLINKDKLVHVRYMYLISHNLLRSGTDKLDLFTQNMRAYIYIYIYI